MMLRQFRARAANGLMTMAIAGIVAAIALAVFALAAHGAIVRVQDTRALAYFIAPLMATLVLISIGELIGQCTSIRWLRRENASSSAEVRRTLSDFLAPWIWIIPMAALMAELACQGLAIVQTADPGATFRTVEVAAIATVLTLASLVVSTLKAYWMARAPNAIVTRDPISTQRANDCYKALTIGRQLNIYWLFAALNGLMIGLAWEATGVSPSAGMFSYFLFLYPVVAVAYIGMIAGYMGLGMQATVGYLGGRLTGWRWGMRPTRDEFVEGGSG